MKIVYGYALDGVIGEVIICGYTAYILSIEETCSRDDHKGRPEIANVNFVIVERNSTFLD
jgi:uncharacterized protein YifN (PemK superfamily)